MRSRPLVRSAAVLLLAGFAALAGPAQAYRMIQNTSVRRVSTGAAVSCSSSGGFVHWESRQIGWHLNNANRGAGKWPALAAALEAWTAVEESDYVLAFAGTTNAGFAADGQNTVLWADGNGCTGSCLAITALVLEAGQVIVEADIAFNNRMRWRTDGGKFDVQSVAAHELGHALGIHHTNSTAVPRPTMFATYSGSGARTLEADDQAALRCSESRY